MHLHGFKKMNKKKKKRLFQEMERDQVPEALQGVGTPGRERS